MDVKEFIEKSKADITFLKLYHTYRDSERHFNRFVKYQFDKPERFAEFSEEHTKAEEAVRQWLIRNGIDSESIGSYLTYIITGKY